MEDAGTTQILSAPPVGEVALERRRRASPEKPRLFERQAFLHELEAMFSESWSYPTGAVLIEAPAWAGRTALLGAACHLAGAAGFTVLRARGRDDARTTAWGIAQQIFHSQRLMRAKTGVLGERMSALAQVLKSASSLDGGEARPTPEILAVLSSALEELAADQPLLIAIDDAHLADPESAEWLLDCGRRVAHRYLALVVTTAPRPRGRPLGPLDRLASEPVTRRMQLGPLGAESVGLLIGACCGEPPKDDVTARLHLVTSGSPFLVIALAQALAQSGRGLRGWRPDQVATLYPARVGQALLARLSVLSGPADVLLALLQAAAVLEDQASLANCAELCDRDLETLGAVADCLIDDGLVVAQDSLRFVHPLVRTVLLEEMGGPRRAQSHMAAAKLLDGRRAPMMVVAKHLLGAIEQTDGWVAEKLENAGREALAQGDRAMAASLLERAIQAHGPSSAPELWLDLARATAPADLQAAAGHILRAAELGAGPGAMAEAALDVARACPDDAEPPDLRAILEGAASRLGPSDGDLRIELEIVLSGLGRPSPGQPARRSTEELLVDCSLMPSTPASRLGLVLAALSTFNNCTGRDASQTRELLSRALLPGELVAGDRWSVRVRARAVHALALAGSFEQARRTAMVALEQATSQASPIAEAEYSAVLADVYLLLGRLGEAEALARRCLSVPGRPQDAARPDALVCLSKVLCAEGRTREALDALAEGTSGPLSPEPPSRRLVEQRARVLLLTGRLDEALPDLELSRILAEQEGVDNPAVTSWRSMLASYYARQGMAKEANRLARENLKFARNFGAPWLVALALVEAAAVAQLPARPALLKEAVELAEAGSAPLVLAMAMVELGSQLRLDQDGASQARDLLRRAADIAFRSGAVALVNRAVSELRTAGARPRRLALSGYQSLTPGERRVAQLAMAGQSNAAIAEELFLSQKTVEGHLARAYRKLGIRSRQQLRAELGTDLEVADQLQA